MADRLIEREVKLSAGPGFELPDLHGVAEGVVPFPVETRDLDAVYFDTADLRLARWGVSLRFRSGDGTTWTVKLPEGEDGPALVRREVPFPGPAGSPPPAALDLVRAYVRRAPLVPVARLQTHRRALELRDEEGNRLAEVVDDEVTVLEGSGRSGKVERFREVEVEVDRRAPAGLLDEVVARLAAAGAGDPDPTPKVMRALGDRALAPPEIPPYELGDDPSAGDVVRAAIAASVVRVLRHDPGIRLGDDPEDVHQARVGTRRLRSDLRTFGDLVVKEWASPLREELRWLAALLGDVRDADVLLDRLRQQAAELPEVDAAGFAPVLRRLADEREAARARLLESMASDRYTALLDRLVAAARSPQLRREANAPGSAVPPLAAKPLRRLRKAVAKLPPDPPDEDLHAVRIRAKRARYAAEAAAPVGGKKARRLAKALAGLQGVLGDHQDAVVAEAWLRRSAVDADVPQAVALGELVAAERAKAAKFRGRWKAAWKKVDRKKLRSWLP